MTWIEEYLAEGEAGRINIPKRVKKQYKALLPIIRGEHPRWYYNEHLANKPIEFGEKFCRQSKDEWRGQPIKYLLWQKAALSAIYGIVERGTDLRKHQRVFILVGKKNGKTTMVAPVALYETARKGNEVYSAANALQQSRIIWTEAANMLEQSPQHQIIKSVQNGIMQHDPMSWEVKRTKFVYLDRRSKASEQSDEALKKWIYSMSAEERERFAEVLFSVIDATGAKTLTDLSSAKLKNLGVILKSIRSLDKDKRTMMTHALVRLLGSRSARGDADKKEQ